MFHRSERLLLRPGWAEDAGELAERIGDAAIVRNLRAVPWPYTVAHAAEWLARPKDRKFPTFLLVLPHEFGQPIIGACGMHPNDAGETEIGYWIAREWWGRGYATEALRAALHIARAVGHRRVLSYHAADNPASGRVMRKNGFVPTGRIRTVRFSSREADVRSPEYALELDDCAGGDDPAMVARKAA